MQLRRTLGGVLDHPNVSAAIILGLGCEVNQIEPLFGPKRPRTGRLVGMTLQKQRRHPRHGEGARRTDGQMIERAAEKRMAIPASKIVLGLNCGGSDSFSGITANPALGVAAIFWRRPEPPSCSRKPPKFSAPSIYWCGAPEIGSR